MGILLRVAPCWSAEGEGVELGFDQGRVVIGRGRGADVRLPHRAVTIRHATIEAGDRGWVLVDHHSTNGTSVGGRPLRPGCPRALQEGDSVELGGFRILVRFGAVARPTTMEGTATLARRLLRESDAGVGWPRLIVENPAEPSSPSQAAIRPRSIVAGPPPLRLILGRGADCDVSFDDDEMSRKHAQLECDVDGVTVRDLSSKNGLRVNGRVCSSWRLCDLDTVEIGATVLRFDDRLWRAMQALDEGMDEGLPDSSAQPAPKTPSPPPPAGAPPAGAGVARGAPADAKAPGPPPTAMPSPFLEPVRAPATPLSDIMVYLLAALVLAASVAGLLWLTRL